MKLTNIDLISGPSYSMNLSFRDPGSTNPYQVRGVFGLDADEIVAKFTGYGAGDGASHYEMSLVGRNIVVRVALNPNFEENESFSDLRDNVYKMISSSRTGSIVINFNNGTETVATLSGFITKIESTHFEKMPEVQITITPDYPMLRSPEPLIYNPENAIPGAMLIADDISTAPHGFQFAVVFSSGSADFVLEDSESNWSFQVQPQAPFETDDILVFGNEYDDDKLYVTRDGSNIQLADAVVPGATFPKIFPGVNEFVIPNNTTLFVVSYYYTFWGV